MRVRTWNCRNWESQYWGREGTPHYQGLCPPCSIGRGFSALPASAGGAWEAHPPPLPSPSLGLASRGTKSPRGDRKVSCPRARSQWLGPDEEMPLLVLPPPHSDSDQDPWPHMSALGVGARRWSQQDSSSPFLLQPLAFLGPLETSFTPLTLGRISLTPQQCPRCDCKANTFLWNHSFCTGPSFAGCTQLSRRKEQNLESYDNPPHTQPPSQDRLAFNAP